MATRAGYITQTADDSSSSKANPSRGGYLAGNRSAARYLKIDTDGELVEAAEGDSVDTTGELVTVG